MTPATDAEAAAEAADKVAGKAGGNATDNAGDNAGTDADIGNTSDADYHLSHPQFQQLDKIIDLLIEHHKKHEIFIKEYHKHHGAYLSGYVRGADGTGIKGVQMEDFTTKLGYATTDANGFYESYQKYGWSAVIMPSKAEFVFVPSRQTYTNLIAPHQQDYIARPVAGAK